MNKILLVVFLTSAFNVSSQDLYKISLDGFMLPGQSPKIAEVIDGRKDKNVVGIIQRGLSNKKDFATLNTPGLNEILNLLERSGMMSDQGLVIRVNKLWISEFTHSFKETGRAEFGLDFFVKLRSGMYYFVTSVLGVNETTGGIDVTDDHRANVIEAITKAFAQYAEQKVNVQSEYGFTLEELQDASVSFRDLSSLPIVQATAYTDGFYTSFDEFVNNRPSVNIDCKIKLGNKIKTKCDNGAEEEISLYGFAKNNQLYVQYHGQFFPLNRKGDTFFFEGPRSISPRAMSDYAKGWVTAGMLGGGVAVSSSTYNSLYVIDLLSGGIRNVTGI